MIRNYDRWRTLRTGGIASRCRYRTVHVRPVRTVGFSVWGRWAKKLREENVLVKGKLLFFKLVKMCFGYTVSKSVVRK